MIYAKRGSDSLYHFCRTKLKYSEGAASRRINAMRLLVNVPDLEPAIQSGDVSITTASVLQSFIRAEKKNKKVYTSQEKKILVQAISGKSKEETEKYLFTLSPESAPPKERESIISPTETEIRFVADQELMDQLEKIRGLLSHQNTNPSYQELFKMMARKLLEKIDPARERRIRKTAEPASSDAGNVGTPPAESNTPNLSTPLEKSLEKNRKESNPPAQRPTSIRRPAIPRAIARAVWQRDGSCCSFTDPISGQKCGSRHLLQLDHIVPVALGGETTVGNLRLRCSAHNILAATESFGRETMSKYVTRLAD